MLQEPPIKAELLALSERATSLASKLFPNCEFPSVIGPINPVDWPQFAKDVGIPKADSIMIMARVADIPFKSTASLAGDGIWVSNGVYSAVEGVFYSRKLTMQHFDIQEHGIKLGLLMGDLPPSSYLQGESEEVSSAKDLVRDMYSSIMLLSKPTCEYTHFSLTGHYLVALCGTREVLYRRLDDSFTPMLELSQERAVSSIGEELWQEPSKLYLNYMKLNPIRKMSFFLGDAINGIYESLKHLAETSSIFQVVSGIPEKVTPNTICVVDFDSIQELTDSEMNILTSVNTLFFSNEKSLPRLYGKMREVIGREVLTRHFGVYSIRVLGTKVCQSCCSFSSIGGKLTDEIYGFSYNVKKPPIIGPGCSSCVGGYEGSYLLVEDSFTPGIAGALIHSFEKDADGNLRAEIRDQFKLAEAINSQGLITKNLINQLEEAVTSGFIAVEDSGNLIN